jgi:hypothetical protein
MLLNVKAKGMRYGANVSQMSYLYKDLFSSSLQMMHSGIEKVCIDHMYSG